MDTAFYIKTMFFGLVVLMAISCKPEPSIQSTSTFGSFSIHLDNKVALQELYMVGKESNQFAYDNEQGLAFNVSQMDYLISDIELIADDGTIFKEASSNIKGIHVVQESDINSLKIEIEKVPNGKYKRVRFNIGILKEFWFLQENIGGVMSSLNDYYENEALGFNHFVMKGKVEHLGETAYELNISGWEDLDETHLDNTRKVEIDFGWDVEVSSDTEPIAHLNFDMIKLLGNIDFTEDQIFDTPVSTEGFANRLQGAFSLEHVHE